MSADTQDLSPALRASIAIVRERDALKAQNAELVEALEHVVAAIELVRCGADPVSLLNSHEKARAALSKAGAV